MATPEKSRARRQRSERRQRTSLVALRLLPEERETLERAARDRGVSLSELLRQSALKVAGQYAVPMK
jgi:uncharacterized protein (DUF1778 family)